jgi:hypothetical protein
LEAISVENVPVGQSVGTEEPLGQSVPAGQSMQTSLLSACSIALYVPTGHSTHVAAEVNDAVPNVPAGHASHLAEPASA